MVCSIHFVPKIKEQQSHFNFLKLIFWISAVFCCQSILSQESFKISENDHQLFLNLKNRKFVFSKHDSTFYYEMTIGWSDAYVINTGKFIVKEDSLLLYHDSNVWMKYLKERNKVLPENKDRIIFIDCHYQIQQKVEFASVFETPNLNKKDSVCQRIMDYSNSNEGKTIFHRKLNVINCRTEVNDVEGLIIDIDKIGDSNYNLRIICNGYYLYIKNAIDFNYAVLDYVRKGQLICSGNENMEVIEYLLPN